MRRISLFAVSAMLTYLPALAMAGAIAYIP